MSNDVIVNDSTVVAIQGISVSNEMPTDGYVLTYVDGYSEWQPKPLPPKDGLRKEYFTSNGSWLCPEGVTNILLIGCGGGGGGGAGQGNNSNGGGGGGGALQVEACVEVVPGNTYAVTIGSGGSGGAGVLSSDGNNGTDGSNTTFGSLFTALGAGKGAGAHTTSGNLLATSSLGGLAVATGLNQYSGVLQSGAVNGGFLSIASGASGGSDSNLATKGAPNPLGGYSGGTNGSVAGSQFGGGGGGAGPQGNGGNGGNGINTAANGGNGSNASANTGAGGGGGGSTNGAGAYNKTGGNGGSGGSGYLYLIY